MNRIFCPMVVALSLIFVAGCDSKVSKAQDKALGGFLVSSGLRGECEMPLKDLKFSESEAHTAGQLKEPAWIVGISFTCANAITGHRPWNVYVGFVDSPTAIKCLAWNGDKEKLKNGMNWLACGGLDV